MSIDFLNAFPSPRTRVLCSESPKSEGGDNNDDDDDDDDNNNNEMGQMHGVDRPPLPGARAFIQSRKSVQPLGWIEIGEGTESLIQKQI